MTKQYTTKDEIISLLQNSHTAVERAIVAIYNRQTEDEQSALATSHDNGIGFNGTDAYILSSFAQQLLGVGTYEYNGHTYIRTTSKHLTEKQMAIASKKIMKYAGQLLSIAASNQPAAQPVAIPVPVLQAQQDAALAQGNHWEVERLNAAIKAQVEGSEVDADWEALAQEHGVNPAPVSRKVWDKGNGLPSMSPRASKFFLARTMEDIKRV